MQLEAARTKTEMDRAAAFFRSAPAVEAKLARKHREAGEALAKGREDALRQHRDIHDMERLQALEQQNARHRAAQLKASLRKEERRQADNAVSFRDAMAAARRELADIMSKNQERQETVQQLVYQQSVAEDEKQFHRGVRETARGPAVRAADAAGQPILPHAEWQHTPARIAARAARATVAAASAPTSRSAATSLSLVAGPASAAATAPAATSTVAAAAAASAEASAASAEKSAVAATSNPTPGMAAVTPTVVPDDPAVLRMKRELQL